MEEGGETMWVAEGAGQIVGFASLKGDEVMAVYTSPGAPPGIGSRLLEAVEAEARRRGLKTLKTSASINAAPFYAKRGFEEVNRSELPLGDGLALPSIEMCKWIAT